MLNDFNSRLKDHMVTVFYHSLAIVQPEDSSESLETYVIVIVVLVSLPAFNIGASCWQTFTFSRPGSK